MKQKPILRHIIYGLCIFLPMSFIGLFIYPLIYLFRNGIRKYKITPLWWFLNDTTGDRDAGDYGRFKHNFIGAYKQSAIRNPHWNLKLSLAPNKGLIEQIDIRIKPIEDTLGLTFCNYKIFGKQFVFYTIGNEKYFRYSFTKTMFWGKFIQNMQLGTSVNRYIYKHRIKKS